MNKSEIVESTIQYIELQLKKNEEALSLDGIADRIGYSKFYLNRIFQEQVGVTIHQYVLERRLSAAAEKLVYTDKAIIDIAYEAGYQSQQTFTNVFSNAYLCSPLKYRLGRRYTPLRKAYHVQPVLSIYICSKMGVAA
ncbi:MAG: helix-turn-helix transcriptional regulator [Oscillospiraceae bacterium]|nr:helix-turn-helix transcriptional regulator [Oscillospiraceae bacterium]